MRDEIAIENHNFRLVEYLLRMRMYKPFPVGIMLVLSEIPLPHLYEYKS